MSGRALLIAAACLSMALDANGWHRIVLFFGAAFWYATGLIEFVEWLRRRR